MGSNQDARNLARDIWGLLQGKPLPEDLGDIADLIDAYAAARIAEALSDEAAKIEAMASASWMVDAEAAPPDWPDAAPWQQEAYRHNCRVTLAALRQHILGEAP